MESVNFHAFTSSLPSLSPLKYFVGSKLITCAITAALSRGHNGVNNEMHGGDSKTHFRLKNGMFYIESGVKGGSFILW